ncbi:hypothetical protein Tco_1063152 [Tanacetum coccineum]
MVVQHQEEMGKDNVADEAVNDEMDDSLERAATTATSLDANSLGASSSGGSGRQETIRDTIAQTRSEKVSKYSNDLLLARGNTLRSGEDRLKLEELMEFCTKLQQRVLDLENTKTAQAQEITSLKLRVKKLEKKGGSRTHKLKRLYKVGISARMISSDDPSLGDQEDASKQGRKIDDIDKDAKITLIDETQGSTADPVTTAGEVVTTASPTETTTADDLTLAQTLIEIRSAKPKVKGVVIGEQSESTTRTRPQQLPSKDKGKGIMEEPEKPTKKKDQIRHDEEVAQRLQAQMQAELEEEDRLVRQREEEANIVSWDNVQAMIDADYQMAQQMQAEEQEKLSIEEKSKLFVQLLEARKKHFAAIRAKEKRNKPPTKAQKRNTMSTYLKNMAGYKHNQLKNKSFDDIQKLFDKAMKRVNTFVDMDTELVEGSKLDADLLTALAKAEKQARVRNGYNSNGSGTKASQDAPRMLLLEFGNAKPLDFKALREVVGLNSWFEKMEFNPSFGSLCLALPNAQQLVKSNLRLALYKTIHLHGGMTMLRPLPPKQIMPCHGQH